MNKQIRHILRHLWQWVYSIYGIRANVKVGKDVFLGLGSHVWAPKQMIIGDRVRMGKNCTVECNGRIGNRVLIGNLVGLIGRSDHDVSVIGKGITEAPWIFNKNFQAKTKDLELIIEDDVWIGYGAIVLTGVCVGRGSIIAAGSVVSNDVPPYAIVAGYPARVVGARFTPEQIEEHEKILYGRVITELN